MLLHSYGGSFVLFCFSKSQCRSVIQLAYESHDSLTAMPLRNTNVKIECKAKFLFNQFAASHEAIRASIVSRPPPPPTVAVSPTQQWGGKAAGWPTKQGREGGEIPGRSPLLHRTFTSA